MKKWVSPKCISLNVSNTRETSDGGISPLYWSPAETLYQCPVVGHYNSTDRPNDGKCPKCGITLQVTYPQWIVS